MPREHIPLRPIRVDYRCDKCGEGFYRPSGALSAALLTNPPQFLHSCTSCGDRKTFTERYPTVRYAAEGELPDMENYQQQTM